MKANEIQVGQTYMVKLRLGESIPLKVTRIKQFRGMRARIDSTRTKPRWICFCPKFGQFYEIRSAASFSLIEQGK